HRPAAAPAAAQGAAGRRLTGQRRGRPAAGRPRRPCHGGRDAATAKRTSAMPVWRFVTDPISHACWAGLTGYFIRLAATRRPRWYTVAWIGVAAAAILHGLNDWGRV